MDLNTYNSVLTKRGENAYEIPNDNGTGKGLTRAHIAFRKDLIRKKIVWYNGRCLYTNLSIHVLKSVLLIIIYKYNIIRSKS